MKPLVFLFLAALALPGGARADERSKNIEFENEVIEGENRRGMDSLTQISEGADNKKTRLYEKRQSFQDENQELLRYLTEEK